jgi:DNA-binding MarR family transcriptional regulator
MANQGAPAGAAAGVSLIELVTVVQRRLARRVSEALSEENATLDQWRVMRALADGRGHLMGELAERLVIAHPTLTRIVDGLVDASQVYRRQSTPDRRRIAVYLSLRGRERLARLDALVDAHERALPVDGRRAELMALLHGWGIE